MASAFSLSGCMALMGYETIRVRAEDDGVYDFYVNGELKCAAATSCEVYHKDDKVCKLLFEIRKDAVLYGENHFGAGWSEKPFLLKLLSSRDDEKGCPGSDAVIELNEEAVEREKTATLKESHRWWTDPIQ